MSFWSAVKSIFSLKGQDEAELQRLRQKHGIDVEPKSKEEIQREVKNEPNAADYDPWDEIRNIRTNFFLGSWATRKFRFRPVGEEKLKKDLDKLAKQREEEEGGKREGEEEGSK